MATNFNVSSRLGFKLWGLLPWLPSLADPCLTLAWASQYLNISESFQWPKETNEKTHLKLINILKIWNVGDWQRDILILDMFQKCIIFQRSIVCWTCSYRVSHKSVYTLFLLISQVLEHIQRNFWPLFNSPGNLLHYSHLNFEIWFWISLDNWGQSWHL